MGKQMSLSHDGSLDFAEYRKKYSVKSNICVL